MITIRHAIRNVLLLVGLSLRRPAIAVTTPASTRDEQPLTGEDLLSLESELAEGLPTNDDAREDGAVPSPPIARTACEPPTPGSYQWWGSHQWIWLEDVYVCGRCNRLWPETPEDATGV